jgi:hypothetical protein
MSDDFSENRWAFHGFESSREGRPVQVWWDSLPDDHRYYLKDKLAELQVTPRSEWEEPDFDPLVGEAGISEIRFDPIECEKGKFFYYRIYGFFVEGEESYIFLHGTNKRERNDKNGKAIAKRRLSELNSQEAGIHPIGLD